MPKLFLVYVGGRAPKANIEVHDVRFVVGETIEDTFDALRAGWFGTPKGLHLDAYVELKAVDGFRIAVQPEPRPASGPKLYFVNFGGYDPQNLAELHQFGMFAAESAADAKKWAKKSLLVGARQTHKDDLFEIDECFAVTDVDGYFVQLEPDPTASSSLVPDWFGYRVIG